MVINIHENKDMTRSKKVIKEKIIIYELKNSLSFKELCSDVGL